jgi:hypothetical protein
MGDFCIVPLVHSVRDVILDLMAVIMGYLIESGHEHHTAVSLDAIGYLRVLVTRGQELEKTTV